MTWDEALAPFRAAERPEVVAAVIDDPERVRACATWATAPRTGATQPRGKDWLSLWRFVVVDEDSWAKQCGVNSAVLRRIFAGLRDARVLYPDGTLHGHVAKAIRVLLSKRLG